MRLVRNGRSAAIAAGCIAVGAVAGPGLADAAQKVVQDVFITNTAANPVPVAPQGTTPVSGTVTVANQPPMPAAAKPIQKHYQDFIDDDNHGVFGVTAYHVPEGKILTVTYAQLFTIKPYEANTVSMSVRCGSNQGTDTEDAVYELPEQPSGKAWRQYGGPMEMVVPGGSCLTANLHVLQSDIPDTQGLGVNGGFTGWLTDAP